MKVTVKPAAHQSARDQLCADLCVPAGTGQIPLIAELLRAVCFASTFDGTPVSEELLVDRTMELLVSACSEPLPPLRARVNRILTMLESTGELTRLFDGTWLGGHTTAIPQVGSATHLFVSGTPLRGLSHQVRKRVALQNSHRVIHSPPSTVPIVDPDVWVGTAHRSLAEWTAMTLSSDGLEPVPANVFDEAEFTFYRPERSTREAGDRARWHGTDSSLSGRALLQIAQFPYPDRYAVGEVRSGRLHAFRYIDYNSARRLQFGIDHLRDRGTRARRKDSNGTVELSLVRPLPMFEARTLLLSGTQTDQTTWSIPTDRFDAACHVLTGVGVMVAR
ncbi:hypothetical protein [Gordonia aichiensis]|uniref:hypothetical protein n=1 Tax=Gordonia aichiensis TaxID=36820 RepID=UPI003267142D